MQREEEGVKQSNRLQERERGERKGERKEGIEKK